MARQIIFLPAARMELIAGHEWYEQQAPGLGGRFLAEADNQMERIRSNPFQFPALQTDVRMARLRRFPYRLIFKIRDETVFVVACFHASRDPTIWHSRT